MSNPSSESTTYNDIIYYVFIMHLKAEQPPPPDTHIHTLQVVRFCSHQMSEAHLA